LNGFQSTAYRILRDRIGEKVSHCIREFSQRQKAEIVELNIQLDHVHLLVMVPAKVSVAEYVGTLGGPYSDPGTQPFSGVEAASLLG
jgi:REP element-mobilizing transposase RayT